MCCGTQTLVSLTLEGMRIKTSEATSKMRSRTLRLSIKDSIEAILLKLKLATLRSIQSYRVSSSRSLKKPPWMQTTLEEVCMIAKARIQKKSKGSWQLSLTLISMSLSLALHHSESSKNWLIAGWKMSWMKISMLTLSFPMSRDGSLQPRSQSFMTHFFTDLYTSWWLKASTSCLEDSSNLGAKSFMPTSIVFGSTPRRETMSQLNLKSISWLRVSDKITFLLLWTWLQRSSGESFCLKTYITMEVSVRPRLRRLLQDGTFVVISQR